MVLGPSVVARARPRAVVIPWGLPPGRGRGPEAYRGPPQGEPRAAVTQGRGRRLGLKMSPRRVVDGQGGQGVWVVGAVSAGSPRRSHGAGVGGEVLDTKSSVKDSYQALLEAVG